MGFALPTLSFFRLTAGIRLPATAMEAPLHNRPLAENDLPAAATPQPYAVLTLNKARSRSRRRAKNSRSAAQADHAQMPLPLQAIQEAPAPTALRIVQNSPREQPECLFISGRMADVCAALERMEDSQSHRSS